MELAFRQMHQVLPLVLSETDTDDPDPKADLVSRVSERFVAYLQATPSQVKTFRFPVSNAVSSENL